MRKLYLIIKMTNNHSFHNIQSQVKGRSKIKEVDVILRKQISLTTKVEEWVQLQEVGNY